MYMDDAIRTDDCSINNVTMLETFFVRLCFYKLKLLLDNPRFGAARVDHFLCHLISENALHPNDDQIAGLSRMPMPSYMKQ